MTEFTIRITEMADRESIVSLWHEVFGDDEGYVRGFLDLLSSCGYTAAAFCGEELCSMTTVIRDLSMETAPCSYLYAVATRESYRGHHLASRVLDFCVENEQKNGRLVFTAPAEAGLFAWYDRTIGAEHIVSCRREHADYLPDATLLSIEKIFRPAGADSEFPSTCNCWKGLSQVNGLSLFLLRRRTVPDRSFHRRGLSRGGYTAVPGTSHRSGQGGRCHSDPPAYVSHPFH